MFSGVLAILVGETIATRSPSLLAWLVVFTLFVTIMVARVEEPRLTHRFGHDHARYRDNVPRWIPRLHPWNPTSP